MIDGGAPATVPSQREVVERAVTATGEWQLQRRAGHYEIICNGTFLMATYNQESDRALAALALERVRGERLRVLVGGLGIGYTVRAALDDPRVSRCDVVEVEPLVVTWYQRYTSSHSGHPLDDPRVHLIVGDLGTLPLAEGAYDVILLDTDNGPDWLALDRNAKLYDQAGLERILQAIRLGGVAAYWSASASPRFTLLLRSLAELEEVRVADQIGPGRETAAWIYLARKRAPQDLSG